MNPPDRSDTDRRELALLQARFGQPFVQRRLQLENQHETRVLRRPKKLLQPLTWGSTQGLIGAALTLTGLRARGRRNTLNIQRRDHEVRVKRLPPAFDGHTVLQLSDLHLDIGGAFVEHLIERVQGLRHDLCVLTGDYRFLAFGPYHPALDALARLRPHLGERVVAVLGNHDTIRMLPGLQALGIDVLLNETLRLQRDGQALSLVGIDDARHFRTHDLHQALATVAPDDCTVLLSHAPEPYRQAALADIGLMLCGHTHGGQICLPGGIPVFTDSDAPRAMARGPWSYHGMPGYTSVGCGASLLDVRLNCLPEVTLHRLRRG